MVVSFGYGCAAQRAPAGPTPSPEPFQEGVASWYGPGFAGKLTASGEVFDPDALTAAHPRLPFGSHVRVVNLENDRSVEVRINDRGPAAGNRIIDLSRRAAELLDMIEAGLARVRIYLLEGDKTPMPPSAAPRLRVQQFPVTRP